MVNMYSFVLSLQYNIKEFIVFLELLREHFGQLLFTIYLELIHMEYSLCYLYLWFLPIIYPIQLDILK